MGVVSSHPLPSPVSPIPDYSLRPSSPSTAPLHFWRLPRVLGQTEKETWIPSTSCCWWEMPPTCPSLLLQSLGKTEVVLEKALESPLDCKEIQPVNPGNQSCIFIGRTDAEAETPILWPPDAKNWFIGKDPDAGKDWGREEKGITEDEMVRWHHRLNERKFE